MFDPAVVGSRMSPGDKVSMTLHKAKAEGGNSFMSNAQSAGMVPGGGAAQPMPQMSAVARPAVPGGPSPVDHRAMLLAHLRRHMLTR